MDVSIVIPTKNGGQQLDNVLNMVFEQKTKYSFEVICVDSGSTDSTIDIIKRYPVKLLEISASEFGHGKTRNFGAKNGDGEFIVFITQDALPVNEFWLENMIDYMKNSDAAGAFGRHIAYPNCNIFDARNIYFHFKQFGDKNITFYIDSKIHYDTDEAYRHFIVFFSDNNSCLRRSVWEKIPYDDVEFAEDQIWSKKILELGYKKGYVPDSCVYHSHNYPLTSYYKRNFDEFKGLYELHKYIIINNSMAIIPAVLSKTKEDFQYVKSRLDLGFFDKLYWIYYAFIRNCSTYTAGYLGGHYHLYSENIKKFLDTFFSQQKAQIKE